MTTIGILGSGRVATALAGKLATTDHNVTNRHLQPSGICRQVGRIDRHFR